MSYTILVVDDSPLNLELATDVLEAAGYVVVQAGTAQQAIDIARRTALDLILMDIGLPDMDGYAALQLLRADESTRLITIVALTAFAMDGDEDRAIQAGFDAYITKPIQTRTLAAIVGSLIVKAQERR